MTDFLKNSGHLWEIGYGWIGRYIFDCGHPDTGPRSELHPATAVAFTHFEPLIFGSPGSEPLLAAKTSIYIHGTGGPIYETPVGGRIYEFDVVLPPKPSLVIESS